MAENPENQVPWALVAFPPWRRHLALLELGREFAVQILKQRRQEQASKPIWVSCLVALSGFLDERHRETLPEEVNDIEAEVSRVFQVCAQQTALPQPDVELVDKVKHVLRQLKATGDLYQQLEAKELDEELVSLLRWLFCMRPLTRAGHTVLHLAARNDKYHKKLRPLALRLFPLLSHEVPDIGTPWDFVSKLGSEFVSKNAKRFLQSVLKSNDTDLERERMVIWLHALCSLWLREFNGNKDAVETGSCQCDPSTTINRLREKQKIQPLPHPRCKGACLYAPCKSYTGHNICAFAVHWETQTVLNFAFNHNASTQNNTQHAEERLITHMLRSRTPLTTQYFDGDGKSLSGFKVFSSLEPCHMCYGKLIMSGVDEVIYLQNDPQIDGMADVINLQALSKFPKGFTANPIAGSDLYFPVSAKLNEAGSAFLEATGKSLPGFLCTDQCKEIYEEGASKFELVEVEAGMKYQAQWDDEVFKKKHEGLLRSAESFLDNSVVLGRNTCAL